MARLRPADSGETLAPVREWMLGNLTQRYTLDELAHQAHMSRRTFIRRFHQETGLSPMAWLTSARLDLARELLETTAVPVKRIAGLSGLGSPAALRGTFHRHLGTSPHDYRATFRHTIETDAGLTHPCWGVSAKGSAEMPQTG